MHDIFRNQPIAFLLTVDILSFAIDTIGKFVGASGMQDAQSVTHISFSPLGGAGSVAVRLTAAQRDLGWKAYLASMVDTPFPRWALRHPRVAASALADFYLVRKSSNTAFFSLYRNQYDKRLGVQLADKEGVLHLHWLPGFIWPPAFFHQVLPSRKVIWSMHDLWPITGGCHYTNGCLGFTGTCVNCPQVRHMFQRRVANALRQKQEGVQKCRNLLLVAPSEWAESMVRASAAMRDIPTAVVPNPVNTKQFCIMDRASVRAKWGISPMSFVVGVGAADLSDERKQIARTLATLHDWIRERRDSRPVDVIIFGAGKTHSLLPPEFRFLGPSRNTAMLAEWYNIMDIYVSLSRYETFGNMLMEAAACGTPSICLTGSGMTEVIIPNQTGRHVQSPEDLTAALPDLVQQPSLIRQMGAAARENAVRTFDDHVIARQFIALYQEPL